jgi:Protein of unknown function (DUF3892)
MSLLNFIKRVLCINKADRASPYERILALGGIDATGTTWKKSQETVISEIELGSSSYYVSVHGQSAAVIVATSPFGHKYLKTKNDGEHPNNLLALPECK